MKSLIIKIAYIHILIFAACLSVKAQDVPLTVISNGKGTPSDLTLAQLKSILKGEKLRWKDGTKVVIALMKTNTPVGISTCRKVYNMSGNDLNKLFLGLVFQGKGEAPTFFNSINELQTFISQTPGAIGVIESTATNTEKVIHIDGKRSI